VKKLVYEDKKYTMEELKKAIEANWEGYEDMRMDFVKAPKWGNDDDYVDQIWVRMYEDLGKMSWSVRDINGKPWATLPENVALHTVQAPKIGALPKNQRLSPSQLQGEKGFKMWRDYMKTWHDLGINHVQFNMVDNETLYAAQREPEQYSELLVRIAGYSAHFVEMNKITQDSIIARNVQKF
jgi:formate C-acetyltransferase/benzylsuccinate synthase